MDVASGKSRKNQEDFMKKLVFDPNQKADTLARTQWQGERLS